MVKFLQDLKSCKKHGSYHADECPSCVRENFSSKPPAGDEKVSKADNEKCPSCGDNGLFLICRNERSTRLCDCGETWEPLNVKIDNINHPPHYNSGEAQCDCGRKLECIDVTRHMSFDIGNAVKYLWRFEHKNGVEDLRKAIWYINDQIKKLESEKTHLA